MGYIGRQPTGSILTGADIADGSISTAKLADTAVSKAKIANDAVDNTKLDLTSNYDFTGTITGAGESNSPRFFGRKASTQTLDRGTQTELTGFTTDEIDSDSAFDGTTFTVPSGKAGIYYFHANIFGNFGSVGNDGEEAQLNFKKNTTVLSTESKFLIANTYNIMRISLSHSIIQDMAVGDTMKVVFMLKDGNASDYTNHLVATASHFLGFKL